MRTDHQCFSSTHSTLPINISSFFNFISTLQLLRITNFLQVKHSSRVQAVNSERDFRGLNRESLSSDTGRMISLYEARNARHGTCALVQGPHCFRSVDSNAIHQNSL